MHRLGGWWRLWIALSTAWLVACLMLSVYLFLHARSPEQRRADTIAWACRTYDQGHPVDLSTVPLDTLKPILGSGVSDDIQRDIRQCLEARARNYAKQAANDRFWAITGPALAAVIPSIALLILGLAVSWVSRGFRQGRKAQGSQI